MKLTASGVIRSAAMQRSPSFSRSSSSTMITNSPRRYSSAASSTVAKGMMALSNDLEALLGFVTLFGDGVDDFRLESVIAVGKGRSQRAERDRRRDRILPRSRFPGQRQRRHFGQRRSDRRLQAGAGQFELDLNLRHVRRRIDSRIVDLD